MKRALLAELYEFLSELPASKLSYSWVQAHVGTRSLLNLAIKSAARYESHPPMSNLLLSTVSGTSLYPCEVRHSIIFLTFSIRGDACPVVYLDITNSMFKFNRVTASSNSTSARQTSRLRAASETDQDLSADFYVNNSFGWSLNYRNLISFSPA